MLVSSTDGVASLTIFTRVVEPLHAGGDDDRSLIGFVPVVLSTSAWAFWVFRARLGKEDVENVHNPLDLLARTPLGRGPEFEH